MSTTIRLTEDQIDDVVYFARTGDLEELRGTVEELRQAASCSGPETVLEAAIDADSGNTPLHMAAANGHQDVLSYLLNPSQQPLSSSTSTPPLPSDSNSQSPTSNGVKTSSDPSSHSSQPSTISPTLLNHANSSGNTALHWAAVNGHVGCVRLLVDGGADVGLENAAKHDALDEAERAGKVEVVRFLLARMGGKKEAEIVMTGGGGEEEEEAEGGGGGGVEDEDGDVGNDNNGGGVRVTQEQLERLGLEDQAKGRAKG